MRPTPILRMSGRTVAPVDHRLSAIIKCVQAVHGNQSTVSSNPHGLTYLRGMPRAPILTGFGASADRGEITLCASDAFGFVPGGTCRPGIKSSASDLSDHTGYGLSGRGQRKVV